MLLPLQYQSSYESQVLGVALLSGRMHYCADADGREYLDPYYYVAKGETITKAW
jgi:hypothetical protein